MGIYWHTIVYLGRLIDRESYVHILNAGIDIPKNWIKDLEDPRGRYILYIPSCYYPFNTVHHILEDYEIDKGYVMMSELSNILSDHNMKAFLEPSEADITKLQHLISLAHPHDVHYGIYVIELQWSSHSKDETHVKHNIRVENNMHITSP